MTRTNVQVLGDALAAHGVEALFGLMGNGNLDLIADLIDRHHVAYTAVRHESAAVAAADGYARAGSRLGVATVTHGPGLTNALTALVTARRAVTPLLLVAGSALDNAGRSTQRLDQRAAVAALGIPVFSAGRGDDWGVAASAAIAATAEGAVFLDLPAEAMQEPAAERRAAVSPSAPPAAAMDEQALREAIRLLENSERPLIIGGRGMVRAGTRDAVAALGKRLGARLGTTLAAKGSFAGRAGDIGLVGGLASPESMEVCRAADVVLVVGAALNGFTTEHATLLRAARVIRIDANPTAPSTVPVTLAITAGAAAAVEKIASEVSDHAREPWQVDGAKLCTPRTWSDRVAEELDRLLPSERTVVFDHGNLPNQAISFLSVSDPTQSIFPGDFGSLGLSVAAATGAVTARPDRRTVVIVGDGGLMMQLPELDTLARTGKPVMVVVFNDGIYGAEYPHLKHLGASLGPATFDSRPFAGIAAAIGLRTATINPGDNLAGLADIIADASGPSLLEVICPPPV